jgi:raffinose/stachyose/melibiose transport system permease protein
MTTLRSPLVSGAKAAGGTRRDSLRRSRSGRRRSRGGGWPIVLSLLPGACLFSVFFVVPLGVLVATSFSNWSVVGWNYAGLSNYEAMFRDPSFWKAVENTAIYAAVGVFIQVPLGCAAGIILSQRPPGWRIFRTILFLPFVISGAAYALVFSMFYNPRYGLLNSALGLIGQDHHRDWLFDLQSALPAVAATFAFIVGFIMILVMAEIASIPAATYEAARVDGATGLQLHLRITVPLLRNVIGTCVLITLLGYLALFDIVFILTAGGPADRTVTLVLYAYRAYANDQWGFANAAGVFIVATGAVSILVVRRAFRIGERDL